MVELAQADAIGPFSGIKIHEVMKRDVREDACTHECIPLSCIRCHAFNGDVCEQIYQTGRDFSRKWYSNSGHVDTLLQSSELTCVTNNNETENDAKSDNDCGEIVVT